MDRQFGYKPSPIDPRDRKLGISIPAQPVAASAGFRSPVYDQGNTMECVAFATASIIEAINKKTRSIVRRISPGYIYGMRAEGDYIGEGMMPVEAFKNASKIGAVRWEDFPVVGDLPTVQSALSSKLGELDGYGIPNRIKAYVRLNTVAEISAFIQTYNVPAFIGMTVYQSFVNTGFDGIVPAPSGSILGGHGMQVVATKGGNQKVEVQNQWGTGWGHYGNCTVDLSQHAGWEAWGFIDEDTTAIVNKQHEFMISFATNKITFGDGTTKNLRGPAILHNSMTYINARDILEATGYGKIKWYPMPTGALVYASDGGGQIETITDL